MSSKTRGGGACCSSHCIPHSPSTKSPKQRPSNKCLYKHFSPLVSWGIPKTLTHPCRVSLRFPIPDRLGLALMK